MLSKCSKCGGHLFQVRENEPSGSRFKLLFVQCSSCGVPVGVVEYHNTGVLISELEKKLDYLTQGIQQIEYEVARITQKLN